MRTLRARPRPTESALRRFARRQRNRLGSVARRRRRRGGRRWLRLVARALLVLVLGGVVAGIVFHTWVGPQWRALIVLSRTSNTPVLGWAFGVLTDEPHAEETVLAGTPALLVRPGEGRSWPAVVFLNGVTRRGRHHPDVERLARALARAGYLVAVPDPPGLRTGTLTVRTLAATTAVAAAVAARPDVRDGRVMLFGVSVGASLALLAAEQQSLAGRIRGIVGLAPYTDLVQVARLTTTHVFSANGKLEPYDPKPFAGLVIARSLVSALAPGRDRSLLLARLLAVSDHAHDPLATLRAVNMRRLHAPARALVRLLVNHDAARFDRLYAALPQRIRRAAALLSPIVRASSLRTRVLIASAPHDKYFPLEETRALARRAQNVRLTVTPTLAHAIPRFSVRDLAGVFRFDAFVVRALKLAG